MSPFLQYLLSTPHGANPETTRPALRKRRTSLPSRDWPVAIKQRLLDVSFVRARVIGQELAEMRWVNLLVEPNTDPFAETLRR